jgi:hypothetical protein
LLQSGCAPANDTNLIEGFSDIATYSVMVYGSRALLGVSLLVCACDAANGRYAPPPGQQPDGSTVPVGQPDGSAPVGPAPNTPTFSSTCNGASTLITGTVTAPNGTDPISNAQVYVAVKTGAFSTTVSCELCDQPIDQLAANTVTGADGSFSLDLGSLAPASQVALTINKGRFRRTTMVTVSPCATTKAGAPATELPGKAGQGSDIPKIAVASGNKDQLDTVLVSMGLDAAVGFDCFEGRKPSTNPMYPLKALTSPCGSRGTLQPIENLLTNESMLESYNLLFLSCAPGKFKSLTTAQQMSIAANVKTWVQKGGRLFATDNSYDYVAQAFPSDVGFLNGDGTVDAADVGVGGVYPNPPVSYQGVVNDKTLVAWLASVGALPAGTSTLSLNGYLDHWSVIQSVPMSTTDVVDATNAQAYPAGSTTAGPAMSYPQTVKFDVAGADGSACGRTIYTSYHTLETTTSTSKLSPQERILEYLMFEAGSCLGPIG